MLKKSPVYFTNGTAGKGFFTPQFQQRWESAVFYTTGLRGWCRCGSAGDCYAQKRKVPEKSANEYCHDSFLVQVLTCFVSDDGDTEQASVDF